MRGIGIAIIALALAGCVDAPAPVPQANAVISDLSNALVRYYAATENAIRAAGGMRTDTNPPDAQFSQRDLQRDFMRIAMYDEYVTQNGQFVAQQQPSHLRRWNRAVRVSVVSGASASADARRADIASVRQITSRIASLTGLDMSYTDNRRGNFIVFFLNRDEQIEIADHLRSYISAVPPEVVNAFRNSPRDLLCGAYALHSLRDPNQYSHTLILVKAEHSDAVRRSCVHEEMAQAMGLTNDSPVARPSVFNDDEEFSLLTMHDEMLLRMLYDPRLQAGMDAAQVQAVLPAITADVWAQFR